MEISEATNPYVGPSPFSPDQGSLFFGREREAKKLLALIRSERAALLYAPSGAGKTSLINARLISALRDKGVEVLPVARVGGEIPSPLRPQNIYVFNMLSYLTRVHEDPSRLEPLQEMTLCELFSHDGPRRQRVLILDQFEEIFTAHPEHHDQREGFFQQVRDALETIPLLTVLFAMREDRIAALDRYAPLLPERLQGRFRMDRLRYDAALMAIRYPAERAGRPFADGVAERLVDDLRQENLAGADRKIAGEFVEPVQLQVVCYQLWENLRESPGHEITAVNLKAFGDVDMALENFFEKAVERVGRASGVAERRIVHWFGETLITPTRIRNQVHKDAETTGGLPNQAVELLEAEHLIRAERVRGGLWIELVHDRFIEPILAAKKRRSKARRATRLRLMTGLLIVALFASLMLFRGILESTRQERTADAISLAEQARAALVDKPHRGLELAFRAAMTTYATDHIVVPDAEDVLRLALGVSRIIKVCDGRIEDLSAVGLSPDGRLLAAAHSDGKVTVWDVESGSVSHSFEANSTDINDLVFGPDNTRIVTVSEKSNAELWDIDSARCLDSFSGEYVTFSPHEIHFAIINGNNVELRDLSEGVERTLVHTEAVHLAIFSNDGKRVATTSNAGTVRIWEVASLREIQSFRDHAWSISSAAFSPDGKLLATTMIDRKNTDSWNNVALWNINTGEVDLYLYGYDEMVQWAIFGPLGKYLVSLTMNRRVRLWDLDSGLDVLAISDETTSLGEPKYINFFDFSADGRRLITASKSDGKITVWDLIFEDLSILSVTDGVVWAMALDPDGRHLAIAGDDRTVRVWDFGSREVVLTLPDHETEVSTVTFGPEGKFLVTGSSDGSVKIWDVGRGMLRHSLSGHDKRVNSVAVSIDGNLVATASSDKTVKVWDSVSGAERLSLEGHKQPVMAAAFSRGGKRLATASYDCTAIIWTLNSSEEPIRFAHEDPVLSVVFSPEGRRLATGTEEGIVKIWNAHSAEVIHTLVAPDEPSVIAVMFSHDGERLISGGDDGSVIIWDSRSGDQLPILLGPAAPATPFAFSRDAAQLAFLMDDGTVRLEIMTAENLIELAQDRVDSASVLQQSP